MIINHNNINSIEKFDGKFEDLSLVVKYQWFYEIYYKGFVPEYNKLLDLKKCEVVTKQQLWMLKQYDQLNIRFIRLLELMKDLTTTHLSFNNFFNELKSDYWYKSKYYRELDAFSNVLKKKIINFENLFHESTKPKNVKRKYNDIARKALVRCINEMIEESRKNKTYINKTNIWLKIRKEGILAEYGDFSTLTYQTMIKIYRQETGNDLVSNKCFKPKHKPRTSVKEIGHIQMDLKVLGHGESGVGKYVYVFDMIDTSTRMVFSKVLSNATTEEVMKRLKQGMEYYKGYGIEIKSIQTDNAMMFKKTNFITNNEFHQYLYENKIKHRRINLGEPQSNGNVERYHLKIDKEAHFRLIQCETIEEVSDAIDDFMYYHNNERYHYFYELSKGDIKLPHADRFMKPIDAIKVIPCYYKNNQSQKSV